MNDILKYLSVVVLILFFASCNQKENNHAQRLKKVEYLKELTKGWGLNHLNDSVIRIYSSGVKNNGLRTGEYLLLEFPQDKIVDFIEFKDNQKKNSIYKLYLDNRYAGKYEANKKIGIYKSIKSIRVTIAKNENGRVVEGWDRTNNYVFIQDTSRSTNSKQELIITLPDNENIITRPIIQRKQLNKIKYADFTNKHNVLLIKAKKKKFLIEQSVYFKDDGSFFVNYLKVEERNKKIIQEYFLHGSWRLIKRYRNRTKIELDGLFSGKLDEKNRHSVYEYKKQVIIDSLNIIRSNDFLDGIMLDLPNWVMVNLGQFNHDFIIDIPYATTENITGKRLYECNKCFLLYQTVKDLLRVQKVFEKKGLKVKLLDCYRPYDVQKILYDAFPLSGYVADPVGGSIHNRGTAVDLTLVDSDGNELDMGSGYDELSIRSNHGYIGFADTVLQNRKLLRETMNSCNFVTIRLEWWHYNHQFARKYPKLNDDFPCGSNK